MSARDPRGAAERLRDAHVVLRQGRNPRLLQLAEAAEDDELVRDVVAAFVIAAVKRVDRADCDQALVRAAGIDVRTIWRWAWLENGEKTLNAMSAAMPPPKPSRLDVRRARLIRLWATGSSEPTPDPVFEEDVVFDARAILDQVARTEQGRAEEEAEPCR